MNRSKFQNSVSFTGYLSKVEPLGVSKAGAQMARLYVDNPDKKNPRFNLTIPFVAMGKTAESIGSIHEDSLVQVQARIGVHYTTVCLYVETISNLDEQGE